MGNNLTESSDAPWLQLKRHFTESSAGELLQQRLRKVDIVARYGGEEFALLLSETSASMARHVGEDLRRVVERGKFLPEGSLTISMGVCDVTQARDMEHWFSLADAALYEAKRNGRNRVELVNVRDALYGTQEYQNHLRAIGSDLCVG